jgi:hypothetical protein
MQTLTLNLNNGAVKTTFILDEEDVEKMAEYFRQILTLLEYHPDSIYSIFSESILDQWAILP